MLKTILLLAVMTYPGVGVKKESPKCEVLCFSAKWCHSCTTVKPIFNRLKRNHKVKLFDFDKHKSVCKKYNVKRLPTVIVIENGKITYSCSGASTCKQIEKRLR